MEQEPVVSENEISDEPLGSVRVLILQVQASVWYNCAIIAFAFVSMGLLAFESFVPNLPNFAVETSQNFDFYIAYVFMIDFLVGLVLAPDKVSFIKNDWMNLISSFPISSGVYRSLRILRFARGIRAIQSAAQIKQVLKNNYAYVRQQAD